MTMFIIDSGGNNDVSNVPPTNPKGGGQLPGTNIPMPPQLDVALQVIVNDLPKPKYRPPKISSWLQ